VARQQIGMFMHVVTSPREAMASNAKVTDAGNLTSK
jgi:hypothetical protein